MSGARSWGDVRADREGRDYDPDLRKATNVWRRGTAGWAVSTFREEDDRPRDTAKIELDFDGTSHFFCGRIVDTTSAGTRVLFETILDALAGDSKHRHLCRRATALEAVEDGVEMLRSQG